MADGEGSTVTVTVVEHSAAVAKVITEVPPDVATPVTSPDPSTVATDGDPLVQLPIDVVSPNEIDPPGQTFVPPVIDPGSAFTVTTTVAAQPVNGYA